MRLSIRDGVATLFVATAAVVYGLWVTGAALGGWSVREAAAVVFALGFATCVTDQKEMAVVYGALPGVRRPPALYAMLVSVLGATALTAGVTALVTGSKAWVAALMAAEVGLWVIATARHSLTLGHEVRPSR